MTNQNNAAQPVLTDDEILQVFADAVGNQEDDARFIDVDRDQAIRIARTLLSKLRAPVADVPLTYRCANCDAVFQGAGCPSCRLAAPVASAPADNWQQYALPGETTAEQVCKRMDEEVTRRTVDAMRRSYEVRETRDEIERLRAALPAPQADKDGVDVALPPVPHDVVYAARRIRRCKDVAAAQVALERFANGHARAAVLADRQRGAEATENLVQEFISTTDALLASQERKTWTSGYKHELTAGERIRIAERWRQLRAALTASTQCTEGGGSNG